MTQSAGDAGHLPPYLSERKDFRPGAVLEFADFVTPDGPKGGRNAIPYLVVNVVGTLTNAVGVWDGRDVCKLLGGILVEQIDGRQRWNLSGYESRIESIKYNGIENHEEHLDVAIGAAQAIDYRLIIPLAKRKVRRGKDFAMTADVFRRVLITCNTLAAAATGAAVLTADDLEVFITAEWYEEDSGEIHSEDTVKSINFTSNTEVKALTAGAVHDMDIVRNTATAGGGDITGITFVRCDELGIVQTPVATLKHSYTARRGIAPSGFTSNGAERFRDPFRAGKALAVVTATPETSVWDGKVVKSAKVVVTGGAADLALITREILPKSDEVLNRVNAEHGISALRMKTAGKSKRRFADWEGNEYAQKVAPWSFPLKKK